MRRSKKMLGERAKKDFVTVTWRTRRRPNMSSINRLPNSHCCYKLFDWNNKLWYWHFGIPAALCHFTYKKTNDWTDSWWQTYKNIAYLLFIPKRYHRSWCSATVMYPCCWFIHKLVQAKMGFPSCLLFVGGLKIRPNCCFRMMKWGMGRGSHGLAEFLLRPNSGEPT